MDLPPDKPQRLDRRPAPRWAVIGLMVLALVVRVGVLGLVPDSLATDPDGYCQLAENLVHHGVFGSGEKPTAYRPPLYPLLLAPCVVFGRFANLAVAALHLGLGLATVGLVYRLGRRWGLGHFALLAALLVACDPILLLHSTLVMTETAATLLAALGLVLLTSACERPSARRAMTAGACLALAILCRATFLPWAILAAAALPAFARTWSSRLKLFASFLAAAVIVLAPWVVRHQVRFGRPIVTTTHGGYTLLLGNNPSFYEYLRRGQWGTVWDADEFNRAWSRRAADSVAADEVQNDRLAYAEAWQNIRREPGMFLYSCTVRAGRLWAPLPHQVDPQEGPASRWMRHLVGLWYLVELPLAAAGLVALFKGLAGTEGLPGKRWWQTGWLWGILLVGCFTAVHTFYWSNLRMRAPLMPAVALAAAAGASWFTACVM
jgi:4-amino-4-deoxy-L-arabinose transferase-like glycosyltransferase